MVSDTALRESPLHETVKQRMDWRRKATVLLRAFPAFACIFVLTLVECFGIPSPFACCAIAALAMRGLPLLAPACGLCAGLAMRLIWGVSPDIWQFIGCVIVLIALRLMPVRVKRPALLVVAALAPRIIIAVISGQTARQVICSLLSCGLAAVCYPAFARSICFLSDRSLKSFSRESLSLLLASLAVLAGAARLAMSALWLGDVLSGVVILTCATILPGGSAVCAGLMCGLSLTLSGHSGLTMVWLAFSAAFCVLLQPRGRVFMAAGYLLACLFTTYLIGGVLELPRIVSAMLACLLFLLIPQSYIRRLRVYARALKPDDPSMESAYVSSRLTAWAGGMATLSESLPEVRIAEPNADEQREVLADRLCEGCEKLPICWHERFEEAKEAFGALIDDNQTTAFFDGCTRREALPACLQSNESHLQAVQVRRIYAQTERDMTRSTLSAVAQAVSGLATLGCKQASEDTALCMDVEERLADTLHYRGRLRFARRVEGRIVLEIERDPFSAHSPERLARELGALMRVPLRPDSLRDNRILLEETPPLSVISGAATACAFDMETSGHHNGDASLVKVLPGGKLLIAVSDGMGHGAQAAGESRKTLELLSLCMETGFDCNQALSAVNGMMLSATNGEQYATVDLCHIDLWTASATLYKLGACATLALQGGFIKRVEGAALPLGALAGVLPLTQTLSVRGGDLLVFMSDGLADALSEDDIAQFLLKFTCENPQALCDTLLREALAREGGKPRDDMTVVCAKIVREAA